MKKCHPGTDRISDHSLASLASKFSKTPKTKTFWKFNSSLLSNPSFITDIKKVFFSYVKVQYAATPYNYYSQKYFYQSQEVKLSLSHRQLRKMKYQDLHIRSQRVWTSFCHLLDYDIFLLFSHGCLYFLWIIFICVYA